MNQDKHFTHAQNLFIRMNVLYKESEFEFTDLIQDVEIKTAHFKYNTLVSINKYCVENNLTYTMSANKSMCILIIHINIFSYA